MPSETSPRGAYGADDTLVDYILGITFEIWEERQVDLIHQYYAADIRVYALDGITHGVDAMVTGTRSMLESFPDRLLLADDVIWSGNRGDGYYSSHRIVSPMTNLGSSRYGPATGKLVKILTIADCFVEEGVITKEWLIRDNHALCMQLGHEPLRAASQIATERSDDCLAWINSEIGRVRDEDSDTSFEARSLVAAWQSGDEKVLEQAYAPYAVLRRSPVELHSGRDAILKHYASLRNAISVDGISVDHAATQSFGANSQSIAVRWTLAGTHVGELFGAAASGKPLFILGSTHWHVVAGRIAAEWTVFDGMGVLAQIVDG